MALRHRHQTIAASTGRTVAKVLAASALHGDRVGKRAALSTLFVTPV